MIFLLVVGLLVVLGALAYFRAPGWAWAAAGAVWLAGLNLYHTLTPTLGAVLLAVLIVVALLSLASPLRRALLSDALLGWFRKVLPQISRTEQEALDAGTVWW